ncbi:uncharacterized protein LOC131147225, partial [Malania oleifera]|uniref:uncharacterized protein LOC131147225 n=1 Tax=Malania oleifera TaxID=397392 RepID=UPI0025ADD8E3
MDRAQLLLFGLLIFIFFSDLVSIFTPPQSLPPKSNHNHPHLHQQRPQPHLGISQTLNFPTQKASGFGGIDIGNAININFCSSCSFSFTSNGLRFSELDIFDKLLINSELSLTELDSFASTNANSTIALLQAAGVVLRREAAVAMIGVLLCHEAAAAVIGESCRGPRVMVLEAE